MVFHKKSSRPETAATDSLKFSEEFNDRILCPELSDSEKMLLHEEVKKIYETYCLDESIDKIRFDPFIVEEIRNSMWHPTLMNRYFVGRLWGMLNFANNSSASVIR